MIERAQLKNLPDAGHEKNQAKHQPREEHRPRAIKRIVCGLFHHLSKRPTPHAVAALPLLTPLRPTSAVLAEGVTSTVATVEGFCALTTTVSANAAATKLNPNDLMSMQSSAAGVERGNVMRCTSIDQGRKLFNYRAASPHLNSVCGWLMIESSMANLALRLPENIPGDFFVDSTCIDCDA